jgi:hypothetical protein
VRGFVRVRRHYVAELDGVERQILAGAFADTATLLGAPLAEDAGVPEDDGPAAHGTGGDDPLALLDWSADPVPEPQDPALRRLLPSASTDDAELAAEFRRLTEVSLRREKVAHLRLVWSHLRGPAGRLAVPREQAPAWAAALTDVRLVLAARLGIETDEDADRMHEEVAGGADGHDEEDLESQVHAALAALYSALTWLQESLVQVMLDDATRAGPHRLRQDRDQ